MVPHKLKLSLGIKVYGTNIQDPTEAILSHHFVANTYREGKLAKLDSIISQGEYEETEQRGVDTPLHRPRNRLSIQSPALMMDTPTHKISTPVSPFMQQLNSANNLIKNKQLTVPGNDMALAVVNSPMRKSSAHNKMLKQVNAL